MSDFHVHWYKAFEELAKQFPDLREVPILRNAVCIGMSSDAGTVSLVFVSPEYGEVIIEISPERGGDLLFRYTIWDDRLGTSYTRFGKYGDPRFDQIGD